MKELTHTELLVTVQPADEGGTIDVVIIYTNDGEITGLFGRN